MAKNDQIDLDNFQFDQGQVTFCVKGRTPLLMNRMSEKAKNELLLPTAAGKKKASGLPKHLPIQEFRGAAYQFKDTENMETQLAIPANMFKGAMANAALDIPGDINKSKVMRLVWVEGQLLELYGTPFLHSAIVNEGKYPNVSKNIRFRPVVPEWACKVTVSFMEPNLNSKSVAKLLATAGIVAGVGDDRQQKGHGNHGQFELVNPDDADFQRIVAGQTKATGTL